MIVLLIYTDRLGYNIRLNVMSKRSSGRVKGLRDTVIKFKQKVQCWFDTGCTTTGTRTGDNNKVDEESRKGLC